MPLKGRFSALKMDGKPLYEYARESRPLPRPIPTRKCQVSIDLLDFTPATGHTYRWPRTRLSAGEKDVFRKLTAIVAASKSVKDEQMPDLDADVEEEVDGARPPTFTVRMTVSSGTYVRSIVHDIGLALGSAAHVVKLTRTRQGQFVLRDDATSLESTPELAGGEETEMEAMAAGPSNGVSASAASPDPASSKTIRCIPWSVFERALAQRKAQDDEDARNAEDPSGLSEEEAIARPKAEWKEWERAVLDTFVKVPVPISGVHTPAHPAYR